ncbi:hypothetical protein OF83DRAFT_1178972 [Amylostereum chailletii]|nr:hypothetical protein OF83DRAFT_1178972 [Amylostereum chailletii]
MSREYIITRLLVRERRAGDIRHIIGHPSLLLILILLLLCSSSPPRLRRQRVRMLNALACLHLMPLLACAQASRLAHTHRQLLVLPSVPALSPMPAPSTPMPSRSTPASTCLQPARTPSLPVPVHPQQLRALKLPMSAHPHPRPLNPTAPKCAPTAAATATATTAATTAVYAPPTHPKVPFGELEHEPHPQNKNTCEPSVSSGEDDEMSDTPLQKKMGKNTKNTPPLQDKRDKQANKKTSPNVSDDTLIDSDASILEAGRKYLKENSNKDTPFKTIKETVDPKTGVVTRMKVKQLIHATRPGKDGKDEPCTPEPAWFVPSYTPSDHDSPQAGPSNSKAQPVQKKGGKRVRAGPQKGVKKASQSSAKDKATVASKRKTRDSDEENKPSKVHVISINSSDEEEEVKVEKDAKAKINTRGIKHIIPNRAEVVIERRKKVREDTPHPVQSDSDKDGDASEDDNMDMDVKETKAKGVKYLVNDEAEESMDEPMDVDSDADSDGNLKGFIVSKDELETVQPKKLRKRTAADDERYEKLTARAAKEAKANKGKGQVDGNAVLGMKCLVQQNKTAAIKGMAVATESDEEESVKKPDQDSASEDDNEEEQPQCYYTSKDMQSHLEKGRWNNVFSYTTAVNCTGTFQETAYGFENLEWNMWNKYDIDQIMDTVCYRGSEEEKLVSPAFGDPRECSLQKLGGRAGSLILCTKGTPALPFEPMWVIQSNLEVDSLQLTSDKLRGFKAIYGAAAYQHSERQKAFLATSFKKRNLDYYTNLEGFVSFSTKWAEISRIQKAEVEDEPTIGQSNLFSKAIAK